MIFNHITINTQRLQEVISRADVTTSTNGSSPRARTAATSTAVVSEAVLADTLRRNPNCTCEDHGLRGDMTMLELQRLGSGCCDRFICPRLDSVRRAYGR